eukprot:10513322-Alexandrium_andersonii.AAC.1
MSASLVGSEMCIRDRSVTHGLTAALEGRAQGRRAGGPRARDPRAPSRGTVSYTHLTLPTICSV